MKKLFLLFALVSITFYSEAQSVKFGPRIGISQSFIHVDETINAVKYETGKAMVGFHGGLFARVNLAALYFQPELLFTSAGGTIDLNDPAAEDVKVNYNRIDVPLLLGFKAAAFRLNVGPVASFNVATKDKSASEIGDEIKDRYKAATFGLQGGIGLDIWKFVVDLKYETSLGNISNNVTIDGTSYKLDQRGRQVILSVGYNFL